MKKFILMAVMAVAAFTASAQKGEFHITPHISLGYGHMSDTETKDDISEIDFAQNLLGGIGADFEYMITNSFGLSAGLDYNYARSSEVSTKIGNYESKVYLTYSFFNVPILAQLHFGEGFAIKAGFQPMFVLTADSHNDEKGGHNPEFKSGSFKDNCESVMFAVPVGVSYTFATPITLDLRCNIPVSNLNKDSDDNNKLLGVTLSVGYRF